MANRLETYRTIAQVLDTTVPADALEPFLQNSNFDWDNLVVEGSRHLMLPALYCSLKTKKLLHCPPEELVSYLDDLSAINRNRNKAIIKQIKALSQVLNSHNIQHVFLKGAAVLMTELYDDPGARMIGDIDILVDEQDLDRAFQLLMRNGYVAAETTFGSDYVEHKHLPKLKTDKYIAAVELHRKLFDNHTFEPLSSSNILEQKMVMNDITVPPKAQLLAHCILNQQINDNAYKLRSIHFRTAYEVHLLHQNHNLKTEAYEANDKAIKSYGQYHNYLFKNDKLGSSKLSRWDRFQLERRLKYQAYAKFYHRLTYSKSYLGVIFQRFKLFLLKRHYRKSLWQDRHRVWHTLKQRLIHNRKPQ